MASGGGSPVGFEDLDVWQQAHQLTVDVYKLARHFYDVNEPQSQENRHLTLLGAWEILTEGRLRPEDDGIKWLR